MRFLEKMEIEQIIKRFKIVHNLYLESSIQIEPDAFLYKLVDEAGNKYGLLCRDYMQDDISIEARILSQEQALIVLNWFRPTGYGDDYRVFMDSLDNFTYMFALFQYEDKS